MPIDMTAILHRRPMIGKPALITATGGIVLLVAIGAYQLFFGGSAPPPAAPSATLASAPILDLSDTQAEQVKVARAGQRFFAIQKQAVGSIDFDEDMAVQVFTPYQGRIIEAFAKLGDDVNKGDVLFTIESPDLLNAESNLISAAGVLDLTNAALDRTEKMLAVHSAAQKDLEQAQSDQETAEANYKSARDAVFIFGKTETEVDRMVAQRRVDPQLIVRSPIAGRITERDAQPGLFVQPGNTPPPYTVANISTMWMVANVAEADVPTFSVGQKIKVSVMAYPDRTFDGQLSRIGSVVDPNLHTVVARSDVYDPDHLLRSGMLATFVIFTSAPVESVAAPANGVVREGDGTMTVWVTNNGRHFVQRKVQVGIMRDGYDQILSGLAAGEMIATDGAVFLDSMISSDTTD
jgi:membrane fusion protein, heavy metal efflux system